VITFEEGKGSVDRPPPSFQEAILPWRISFKPRPELPGGSSSALWRFEKRHSGAPAIHGLITPFLEGEEIALMNFAATAGHSIAAASSSASSRRLPDL